LFRVLKGVSRFCHLACAIPLFALVAITSADVVARYFLSSSVPDTAEISGMLLGICISLSLPYVTLLREQVRFDLVLGILPLRAQALADVVTLSVSTALFGLIAWQTVKRVLYSMSGGEYIGSLEIPVWPAKSLFAFSCLLTAIVLAALWVAALRQLVDRSS
jgi:TRAP-type C4-dicarboxylate transport system permease small subunit